MKSILLTGLFVLTVSNAKASTYLGKIGPFYEGEYTQESVLINKCNLKIKNLTLNPIHASGKYSMPRFAYREIEAELQSKNILHLTPEIASTEYKTLKIKLPEGDCVSKLSITATSTGFNPGHSNTLSIEVWGEK